MNRDNKPWAVVIGASLALILTLVGTVYFGALLIASSWTTETRLNPGLPRTIANTIAGPSEGDAVARENRDLAAQEAMVSVAFLMLVVSLITVFITAFGTLAIFRQIKLTGDAVRLSQEANAHAQDISERQLRAYITATFSPPPAQDLPMTIRFKNSGQTPAISIFYFVMAYYVAKGHEDEYGDYTELDGNWLNLASGDSFDFEIPIPREGYLLEGVADKTLNYVSFEIECDYWDIFEKQRKTKTVINSRAYNDIWLDTESSQHT